MQMSPELTSHDRRALYNSPTLLSSLHTRTHPHSPRKEYTSRKEDKNSKTKSNGDDCFSDLLAVPLAHC